MSEERRQVHPEEPAEGSREDVEAPGVSESRDDMGQRQSGTEPGEEERSSQHPQEPAEGGDEETDEPGADRPSDA